MSRNKNLLQSNINALKEGINLLSLLQAEHYTQGYTPAFHSTIGAHFRHLIEHYRCFITQLPSRQFCYDQRERDQLLESDFNYANQTLLDMLASLRNLDPGNLDQICELVDQQAIGPIASTVSRELLFLQSHTMHHYAIIGAMARSFGVIPEKEFGVAIATREHQKEASIPTADRGSLICAQ